MTCPLETFTNQYTVGLFSIQVLIVACMPLKQDMCYPRYDIVGHSGEDYGVDFVHSDRPPKDDKQRLQVLKVRSGTTQWRQVLR